MALYVNIDNSYSSSGTGVQEDPLNWTQFKSALGGTTVDFRPETDYYLSGSRLSASEKVISIFSAATLDKWGDEPYKISFNDYLYIIHTNNGNFVEIKNAMIETPKFIRYQSLGYVRTNSFMYDNCYIRTNGSVLFSHWIENCDVVTIQNCTFGHYDNLGNSYKDIQFKGSYDVRLVNNIFYGFARFFPDASDTTYLLLSNCVTNATVWTLNNWDAEVVNNNQISLSFPTPFSIDISAVTQDDLNYLSGGFENVTISGNTSYNDGIWWNGTRDGVGALYFPTLSGFALSSDSTTAAVDTDINFVLSGNPFTAFSASSVVYYFDDGNTSAVNDNSVIAHSFSANGGFEPFVTITTRNGWYTSTTDTITLTIGSFAVIISIFDQNGNDVTDSSASFMDDLTLSAQVTGLEAGTFDWSFGDGTTGSTNPISKYYTSGGDFTVVLNTSASDDTSVSATDTATIGISGTSDVYYVDINSSYDVCASNVGTSVDPFNWSEFTGRLETSGHFNDTYRLSGSRQITASTADRYVLSVDKRKAFEIRDWDVSAFGPWVIIVKDFSINDDNSILSAVGTTLRNGIIYNKPFSSPGAGGKIILTNAYDTFIVYQGDYSHIEIDGYNSILSAATTQVTISGISSDKPDWVDPRYSSYIYEDYNYNDLGCGNVDPWWDEISAATFSANPSYEYSACVKYENSYYNYNTSSTCFSGGFILENAVVFGLAGAANKSIHWRLFESVSGTEISDLEIDNNDVQYNGPKVADISAVGLPGYYMRFKYEREPGSSVISAFYKHEFEETIDEVGEVTGVYYYAGSVESDACLYSDGDGGTDMWGTGELYWQAETGFPYTWTSGVSSTTSGVDSPGYIITSANSDLIGCTIYQDGDGWKDSFNSATFSGVGQTQYNMNLVDSVFTNFSADSSNDFSACNTIIKNCAFTNESSAVSSDFNVSSTINSQYGWTTPSDYPFTKSNALYNQNIDYINNNKSKLAPFDGISAYPNPGYNYSAYPGYDTGLFGNSRKDYLRP